MGRVCLRGESEIEYKNFDKCWRRLGTVHKLPRLDLVRKRKARRRNRRLTRTFAPSDGSLLMVPLP
jgi:hypothetical protein